MSALREAAQQALEALKDYERHTGFRSTATDALRAALAQQEQEQVKPVEIKQPNPEGATQCIVRWLAETPAGWIGAWDREALERFTAHPPRMEWQGLRGEDVLLLARRRAPVFDGLPYVPTWIVDFYRDIEKALKERNQ